MMHDMMDSIVATINHCDQTKERSAHMQIIFSGICIIVFFVTTVNLGPMDLNGWLKAAIVIPLVFLVVYSLARIQPREKKLAKIQGNIVLQKSANAPLYKKTPGSLEA
jgi:hypothetical protein